MQQGRWVSYIYRYRNNVRCENAGFIKVQRLVHKTEDDVRIQIGLKLYKKRACTCTVYLLYDGNKAKHLTDIRFAAEERDTIMSRIEVPWQDPLRDGVGIDAYDGLFFRCDDGEMLTGLWNEYTVSPEQIQVVETAGRTEQELPEQRVKQAETDAAERTERIETDATEQAERTERTETNVAKRTERMETDAAEQAERTERTEQMGTEAAERTERMSREPSEQMRAEAQTPAESEIAETLTSQDSWQMILDTYPKLPLFADSQFLECVKIAPQDIGRLAIGNWRLGVNSFVSHGYYHYRYLMLGRVRFEQGECVVIGVPGVFTNKEKYLANMFGFDTFIPVKKTSVLTGNFGYWVSEVLKE